MIRIFCLTIFVLFSLGCKDQSESSETLILEPIAEGDVLGEYFLRFSESSILDEEIDRIQSEYPTAVIYSQLPSTNSVILSVSKDDADDIQQEGEGHVLTPYFGYGETNDFEEIVGWSRYYFSEDDFLVFKQHIDNIYFSSVGDEVNFTFLGSLYSGEIKSYETHDIGSVFVRVGSKEGQMSDLTVSFNSGFDSAKLYFGDSQVRHVYEYNQHIGLGYLFPLHEYKYLLGALELD